MFTRPKSVNFRELGRATGPL